jgi:hypothetical protein
MASPQKSPKTGLAPSDLVAGASLDGLDRNLSILQRSRAGLPNGLSQALAIGRRKDPLESQGPRVDHVSPNVGKTIKLQALNSSIRNLGVATPS